MAAIDASCENCQLRAFCRAHLPARLQVHLLDLSGRDPQLRLRAANLLGLLIRHASSISPALVNAGKPQLLLGHPLQHSKHRPAAATGGLALRSST